MTRKQFEQWLNERVAVLDGAMGTMIQRYQLGESDFRGSILVDHDCAVSGNNDLLSITRPDVIADIHRQYVEAGADIISTNTFNANAISQSDYTTERFVPQMNRCAARLAVDIARSATDRRVLVAGSVGPTNRAASMSPDVSNPAARNVDFDMLFTAYHQQIEALVDGGVDLLLVETVFDTLNLKAALTAALDFDIPVMVSVTVTDKTGRTLIGQSLDAFLSTIQPFDNIVSVGLNCSFGPSAIEPHVRMLDAESWTAVSVHPNAGLPDETGCYNELPEDFVSALLPLLNDGIVNIVGGCCGTTPAHIKALSEVAARCKGKLQRFTKPALRLAGLEPLVVTPGYNFVNVGERCNVAGSRKFLRLISEGKIAEAADIARRQVESGAMVIDVNMDDGLLDSPVEMVRFLRYIAADPEISKVPVMIDSSRYDVIECALKQIAGRPVVNSISLKEGESRFIETARMIRRMGAAVVVMAFDENGQADTYERKKEIVARSYRLLTEIVGFSPEDIIFDPGILSIATGIDEHDNYAVDFIETVRWIKANLPGTRTSGGVSNLSFSFRGHNRLREAMHAVFLYHAIEAGLDMAILNPATAVTYEDIDPELRLLLTDVIMNRRPGARDELIVRAHEEAETLPTVAEGKAVDSWHSGSVENRLSVALVKGMDTYLNEDIDEALRSGMKAVEIIEGPLMEGMNRVGRLFGEGKMFLPQVVKTARTMKIAVDILRPVMQSERESGSNISAGKVVLATVKGDVHDIGKNIVGIVLACNNFEVIDLGVMVPAEDIVDAVVKHKPAMVGLSGLITPSLGEMVNVARALERAGDDTPLVVGGATTSPLHTALKIAPERANGAVIHSSDAGQNTAIAVALCNEDVRKTFIEKNRRMQERMRAEQAMRTVSADVSPEESRRMAKRVVNPSPAPLKPGTTVIEHIPIDELLPLINWRMFFHSWRMTGDYLTDFPYDLCDGCIAGWRVTLTDDNREKALEALNLYRDALSMLNNQVFAVSGCVALLGACSDGDDIVIDGRLRLPMLRQPGIDSKCLADWITSDGKDFIGIFAATARRADVAVDDGYQNLLGRTLCDRLVEAASEWLHRETRQRLWGYATDEMATPGELLRGKYRGIRPAIGYPSIPDQTLAVDVASLLPVDRLGISVTVNGGLSPASSQLGLYFAAPEATYFNIINPTARQIDDYACRRGLTTEQVNHILARLTPSTI